MTVGWTTDLGDGGGGPWAVTPAGVILHAEGSGDNATASRAGQAGRKETTTVKGEFGTTDGGKTMSDIDAELGPVD